MVSSGLLDSGFSGSSFTWSNNRQGKSYVATKLDYSLTNQAWSLSFPDGLLQHLVRQNTDPSPILLSSRPPLAARYIPFKFEEMWIGYPSFKDLVATIWNLPGEGNPQFILNKKLKSIKLKLKAWNKEVLATSRQTFQLLKTTFSNCKKAWTQIPWSPPSLPSA